MNTSNNTELDAHSGGGVYAVVRRLAAPMALCFATMFGALGLELLSPGSSWFFYYIGGAIYGFYIGNSAAS